MEESIKKDFEDEKLLIKLGKIYRGKGEYTRSVDKFKRAAEISSHKNERWFQNRILNEIELSQKKIILKSKPRSLFFVLTTRCNLNCIMCVRRREIKKTLPVEAFEKIRYLFPFVEVIDWQGGEVFLLDYFKNVYVEVSKYTHILQRITTNGLLIDKKWAKIFSVSKCEVHFSIDAVTKRTYESIRKNASFKDLIKSIELVNSSCENPEKNSPIAMTVVVMKRNLKELHLFPGFCKKYNFKHLTFNYLNPVLIPEEDIFIKRDEQSIEYLKKTLEDVKIECRELGIDFCYLFKPLLFECRKNNKNSSLKKEIQANLLDSTEDTFSNKQLLNPKCYLPWQRLSIDFSGRATPDCVCSMAHVAGNILCDEFNDIWNGDVMQTYRRKIIDGNIKNWCSKDCVESIELKREM